MQLSGKVYLGTIYRLKKQGGRVRSVELARELGYTKPSVSRAVNNFIEDGYIIREKGGVLSLTEKGLAEAKDLIKKQEIIAEFLVLTCGVDEKQAIYDAIRMEPGVSKKTMAGMKSFVKEVRAMQKEQQ
ncbi:MAG: metal-dependent transcriptional regulator [Lachnospiraceae bacterium]|nr:metal-dependent transcriptional regulator [Lachnospiraceae bacterium]